MLAGCQELTEAMIWGRSQARRSLPFARYRLGMPRVRALAASGCTTAIVVSLSEGQFEVAARSLQARRLVNRPRVMARCPRVLEPPSLFVSMA
jgi:hypothetical protein